MYWVQFGRTLLLLQLCTSSGEWVAHSSEVNYNKTAHSGSVSSLSYMVLQRYKNAILLLLAVVCLSAASDVRADFTDFNIDFDNYTVGALDPQGGWEQSGATKDVDITSSTECLSGKCVVFYDTSSSLPQVTLVSTSTFETDPVVTTSIYLKVASSTNQFAQLRLSTYEIDGGSPYCQLTLDDDPLVWDMHLSTGGTDATSSSPTINANTWYRLAIQLDRINNTCTSYVNDNLIGSLDLAEQMSSTSTITATLRTGDPTEYVYFDEMNSYNTTYSTSVLSSTCDTCTRIVEFWDPENGETLDGTTTAEDLDFTYFVYTDYLATGTLNYSGLTNTTVTPDNRVDLTSDLWYTL